MLYGMRILKRDSGRSNRQNNGKECEGMNPLKNWAKTEKKKISEIDGMSAKIEYIWDYYKLWIIGIVAAVWFLSFAFIQYTVTLKDYWFYIMFTNTYADIGDHSELYDGYVEYTGYDLKKKNIVFNNNSYFDYLNGVTANTYFEAFVAYTDSGTLDAVTMENESLTALGESGRLLDLDSEACASIKEKYGDRFLYCTPYDKSYSTGKVAVGIDISDSKLMTQYNIYPETCALGIGAHSGNIEAVEKFLDYIYTEE